MSPLVSLLVAVLVGALILLGIGGIVYHLFRDGGWLSQGMDVLWEAQYQSPLLTIALIIAALFVIRTLHSAQLGGKRESKLPDFALYAFIATGIYFLGRLVITGQI